MTVQSEEWIDEALPAYLDDYMFVNEGEDCNPEDFEEGFRLGSEALSDYLGRNRSVMTLEALRSLPAGSLISDGRFRLLFKTHANGWVTVDALHVASSAVRFPVKVEYAPGG